MESEVSREHDVYVKTKVDFTPGADAPTELCMGYHKLISMHKESNETCVVLPVSPLTTDTVIVDPEEISARMSALMRHFTVTSKIREKTCSVWETARLGFNRDFD